MKTFVSILCNNDTSACHFEQSEKPFNTFEHLYTFDAIKI